MKTETILKDSFWEYNINVKTINNYIKNENYTALLFIFNKIISNSKNDNDFLEIFDIDISKKILSKMKPDRKKNRRILIKENLFLGSNNIINSYQWNATIKDMKKDYNKLYELQDIFLKIVNKLNNNFYLTGGTALSRFYLNHRYSDDLDFFTNNNHSFFENYKEILITLNESNIKYEISVDSNGFKRLYIEDILQVDFVNDLVYRESKSEYVNDIRIDNIKNIFANKFTALIGRDEPKDVYDIIMIWKNIDNINLNEIINIAKKKEMNISPDIISERLRTFPLSLLNIIKTKKPIDIKDIEIDIINLIADIQGVKSKDLNLKLNNINTFDI